MVQRFDSYIFRARRALPAPAQAEIDCCQRQLPPLRQTLERIDDLDPNAQDARRLMSVHLPNLIDRYLHVPPPIASSAMARASASTSGWSRRWRRAALALTEISEKLARADVAAFETQGRFIKSRYQEKTLDD